MKTSKATLIIPFLFLFGQVLAEGTPPKAKAKRIVAFGDDLVAGVGAKSRGLVDWLSLQTGFEIINAGKAGDRAELALGRLKSDVLEQGPDVVVLLLGGNDVLEKRLLYETRSDLYDIVERIKDAGGKTVVVGISSDLQDPYRTLFRDLSINTDSAYVHNILDGVSNPFTSGRFPSDEEYQVMANRISPVLTAVVNTIVAPPSLSISYSSDENEGDKVTLQWTAEGDTAYDVLQGPAGVSVSEMNVVGSVSGTSGETHLSFNVTASSGFYALRAKRL